MLINSNFFGGVDLGDCFSSGPVGSQFSGATEIHYYLQSLKGYVGGPSVYCFQGCLFNTNV